MRLLLLEDEHDLRSQLAKHLRKAGYAVDEAADGEEGLFLGIEHPFDIGIIDLGLPKLSGIEVIQSLRKKEKTFPILILTAQGRWQDKVEGLEAGADDYLVKPFHIKELMARIKALARRSVGISQPVLQFDPITLNTSSQQVTIDEKPIELTAYEYKVLEYLMMHSGKTVSKTELTEHLYAQDFDRDSNVIEVFVGRLRRKLDPDERFNPIETLRGRGYRFTLQRSTS